MSETLTPAFQGEIQLRRWSESSTQGVQVTFALADSDDLEPLKAKSGKRFMAVLVEVGDDELPVQEPKQRPWLGDLCFRAVQWCGDWEFRVWLQQRGDFETTPSVETAGDIICEWCGVASRKELDTNPEAAEKFRRLIVGPWQKHCLARGRT